MIQWTRIYFLLIDGENIPGPALVLVLTKGIIMFSRPATMMPVSQHIRNFIYIYIYIFTFHTHLHEEIYVYLSVFGVSSSRVLIDANLKRTTMTTMTTMMMWCSIIVNSLSCVWIISRSMICLSMGVNDTHDISNLPEIDQHFAVN